MRDTVTLKELLAIAVRRGKRMLVLCVVFALILGITQDLDLIVSGPAWTVRSAGILLGSRMFGQGGSPSLTPLGGGRVEMMSHKPPAPLSAFHCWSYSCHPLCDTQSHPGALLFSMLPTVNTEYAVIQLQGTVETKKSQFI